MTPEEVAQEQARDIIRSIIVPTMSVGGNFANVMVLLETVIIGVMLYGAQFLPDEDDTTINFALDNVIESAKKRIADGRLSIREPEGNA